VSGCYNVGGVSRSVWNANAGSRPGNSQPFFYTPLAELRSTLAPDRFQAFVGALTAIPAYREKMVKAATTNYERSYPQVPINDLLRDPEQVDQLLDALDIVVKDENSPGPIG
jgi:hypothetical protein